MEKILQKEIKEAITSGERALESLNGALKSLNEGSSWGVVDMIGGKFVSSIAKAAALKKAQEKLRVAMKDLDYFQVQLRDVTYFEIQDMKLSSLMMVFDIIADNIFVDAFVQAQIETKKKEVKDTIIKINYILDKLKITLSEIADL